MGYSPLWGEQGAVREILRLNSNLVLSNGNFIVISDILHLPKRPNYLCNVKISNGEVKVVKIVRTKSEHRDLLKSFETKCVTPIKHKSFSRYSRFKLVPRTSFSKISARDNVSGDRAEVFSDVNYGIKLSWEQHWSEFFSSYIYTDVEKQSYSANPNRILLEDSISLFSFGFGTKYKISDTYYIAGEIGFGEQAYLYAPDVTNIRLDKANSLNTKATLGAELLDLAPFRISTEVGANSLFGTTVEDYKSKNGLGLFGSLNIEQTYNEKKFFAGFSYSFQQKDTDRFSQDHKEIRINFGLSLELGE